MGNERDREIRRVVVTGMGVISPLGKTLGSSWDNMLAGVSGGGPVTLFDATDEWPCRIGCEVRDFDPTDYLDRKEAKRHDRVSQFSVIASAEALASAGLDELPNGTDPTRCGVIFGSGIGGIVDEGQQRSSDLLTEPVREQRPPLEHALAVER